MASSVAPSAAVRVSKGSRVACAIASIGTAAAAPATPTRLSTSRRDMSGSCESSMLLSRENGEDGGNGQHGGTEQRRTFFKRDPPFLRCSVLIRCLRNLRYLRTQHSALLAAVDRERKQHDAWPPRNERVSGIDVHHAADDDGA